MRRPFLRLCAVILMPLSGAYASDIEQQDLIKEFFGEQVTAWIEDDALISAIRVRNVIDQGLTLDEIDVKDKEWRAQVGTDVRPLVDAVLNNDAADFLRRRVADSGGAITEIIVMDALGLNVAVSSATSDYWQGDEAKHTETFGNGVGALHISDLEIDGSTGVYQVQVSTTVTDPNSNEPIGAITVGLIADAIL